MNAMMRYRWPGNIRELENFVERAVILTKGTNLNAPVWELERETGCAEENLERSQADHDGGGGARTHPCHPYERPTGPSADRMAPPPVLE